MVDRHGPVWIGALGKANIEKNIDADENTLFRLASTSKMLVALSVLKLVEEGELNLNARLSDLAPEIAYNRILRRESLARMERVESTSAAREGQRQTGYGLNNYSSLHEQWVYREHGGGFDGAMAELSYLPEAMVAHVITINSKNVSAFRKFSELIRDYETRSLPDKRVESEQAVTDQHREIAGLYYSIASRVQKLAVMYHAADSMDGAGFGLSGNRRDKSERDR